MLHGAVHYITQDVDLMVRAVTFTDLTPGAELFEIAHGVLMPVAALNDVIGMKEAADRIKDHLALPELRALRGDLHPERQRDGDLFAEFNIEDGWDD